MTALLRHRGLQVFFVLALYLALASWLPPKIHQAFYTISLAIKDLLLWMLPATVCFFIAYAIASFERKAPLFVFALFLFEALSNSASVWYAFGCGHLAAGYLPFVEKEALSDSFEALLRIPFTRPAWWSASKGTFAGIALGFAAAFKLPFCKTFLTRGKRLSEKVLTRFFSRLIPLFVLGFVAKMHQTNLLGQMARSYADLILWLALFLLLYIAFLFFISGGRSFLQHAKNLLPAGGVALSSGCSISTMPWTIEGTAKNLHNPELAKAVIPATVNIQQAGDCVANAFLCFLLYRHFNGVSPDLSLWIPFSIVFVLARFATAAVLGGAIFIMLPIYESQLGFTPEMAAAILAFNVILDPLITASNVLASGALCRLFEKSWAFFVKDKRSEEKIQL